MDDNQTLDDLAALFLSPPGETAAPATLAGPAPVRLRPKPGQAGVPAAAAARPKPPASVATAEEPRLRLTGAAAAKPSAAPKAFPAGPGPTGLRRRPFAPAVEAVLLGNLPGLADAWLPQYAQLLALRDGPVLLLHPVDAEAGDDPLGGSRGPQPAGFELEWIGPGGADAAALLGGLPDDAGLADRVEHLLTRAAHPPATLLVHAGTDGAEAAARFAATADWAVLSGLDPVAVQAAAALLRRVVAAAPAVASASVGLMVMGSTPKSAAAAAEALDDALHGLLDHPVDSLGALPRMNPVSRTPLGVAPDPAFVPGPAAGRRPGQDDAWAGLQAWLDTLPSAPPPPATPPAAASSTAKPADRKPAPCRPPTPPPRGCSPIRCPRSPRPLRRAGPRPTPRRPRDSRSESSSATSPTPSPRARAWSPSPPAAPASPACNSRSTSSGRLHLVARHAHSADHPHPREAMLALRDASEWAREHQAWLSAAHPHRRVDATDPVPHLLTDRPDLGLSLAQRLGPALRLYLLHGDVCYSLTDAG